MSTKEQLMAAIAPQVMQIEQAMRDDLAQETNGCDPLLAEVLEGVFYIQGCQVVKLIKYDNAGFVGLFFYAARQISHCFR